MTSLQLSGLAAALALAVTGLPAGAARHSPAPGPSAHDVIEQIKDHVGVPWQETTVDTFKAGDPETPVTGVAVTMMATLDVLQRAVRAGANLVITHEPTFFDHLDRTETLASEADAVLRAKQAFIDQHDVVVWRFHDHWHLRQPDGIQTGVARALGWTEHQRPDDPRLFTLPDQTLDALAARIRRRLGARTLRVVGDPALPVRRVALVPGAAGFDAHRRALQREDVDVLVIGEAREWETVEYAADAVAAGFRKGLVIVSHIPSEQAGMEECARWLKTFLTGVPVQFVPAADPFWMPAPAR